MQFITLRGLLIIAVLGFSHLGNAQNSKPNPENFDRFIAQVYVQDGRDFIKPDSRRYAYMKELYNSRILYVKNDKKKLDLDSSLKLLSGVPLYTVYQKGLSRDISFNPETFNPFKYNFDFYSPKKQIFRVDGTEYLIIIHPQIVNRN